MRTYFPAILLAIFLFVVTAFWVPISFGLVAQSSQVYYRSNWMQGVQMRSLMGTIAYLLALSPVGFVWLLQLFKMGWLLMLCIQFFRNLPSPYVATILCTLFACTSTIYLANYLGGFVDIAADFWLLLAATAMLESAKKKSILNMCLCLLALCLAVLTHEKATYGCGVILLWLLLNYRWQGLVLALLWAGFTNAYFTVGKDHIIYGGPPDYYLRIFSAAIKSFLYEGDMGIITHHYLSIFSASGMLWVLFAVVGIGAIKKQNSILKRAQYALFVVAGYLACLLPLFMGGDVERMTNGIWLPLYILLIDQAKSWQISKLPLALYVTGIFLLELQLLVPPLFTVGPGIRPLNAYALQCVQIWQTHAR